MAKVAVVGCVHGELDTIYSSLKSKDGKVSVDLVLVCGDFQVCCIAFFMAMRNARDLDHMVCPRKFKKMGDFADYHNGRKVAPVPTIFIGGNHEASNFLWEKY